MFAYVGSRTTRERNARGEGITVFSVDTSNGDLRTVQVLGGLTNPSYLLLNSECTRLYAVHGDQTEVSAFAVDKASGRLNFINRESTHGLNPVHLALDPSGGSLVISNHIGASLAVLPIDGDGSLRAMTQLVPLTGPSGPHRIEQTGAKPHFNPFDVSGRFVLVPDKGLDRIFSFRFDHGALTPATPPFVQAREGAGPRNLVFHPSGFFAYVSNELDSTVTAYGFDPAAGSLTALQVLPTVPSDYTGNSRAASIAIDSRGTVVRVSNRGHDSIATFRVDPITSLLSLVEAISSGGRTPRFFALSPDDRFVYALNEGSDTIVAFRVELSSGRLLRAGAAANCGSPVCMVFSSM